MQGRELLARRDFCSAQGFGLPARRDFAPRRVENCFRVGILLRARLRTAFAWVFCFASSVTPTEFILLRLFIRGCATAYPCLRSFRPVGAGFYQGLRYRLPLPEVFRPVGAGFSFSKQKCKVIPTENRIFAR